MVTAEQITEALTAQPELATAILPTIQKSEAYTTLFNNQVSLNVKDKIGEELKKQHDRYDNQFFDILGRRPGTKADGSKEKTHELLTTILTDYKELNGKRDTISKDETVAALNKQIEALKNDSGSGYFKELLEQTKTAATTREAELQEQIAKMTSDNSNFKKSSVIKQAISQLKLNPDTPKSLVDMVTASVEAQLLASSKFEGDKLVFIGADGKPVLDPTTMGEKNAFQMLQGIDAVKSIVLKDGGNEPPKGGGADKHINGAIETTKIEGKGDVERLMIPSGSFATQSEFNTVAEKLLQQQGVLKTDNRFFALKDLAFKEHKVNTLPQQ